MFWTSLYSSAALIKHRLQWLPKLIVKYNEQEVPAHKEKVAKTLIYVPRRWEAEYSTGTFWPFSLLQATAKNVQEHSLLLSFFKIYSIRICL